MNKPSSFFPLLCCFAALPWGQASAQDIEIQPCSFNGGRWIQTRYIPVSLGFRLNWSDGPQMTYTLASGDNAVIQYLDSLGGQWLYNPSTGHEGFILHNVFNGNRIVCAQVQSTDSLCPITSNGIGPIQLGMTLFEAKQAFPGATFSRGSDGEGVALVNVSTKETRVMVLFADEDDRNKPINWTKKISFIETFSSNCSTGLGVRPGSLIADTKKLYGLVLKISRSEVEARQFAEFKNQPRGMIFRIDYSGVFAQGQSETVRYRPDAKIYSIAIQSI